MFNCLLQDASLEQLHHQLCYLLERAYKIQDHCEEQVFQNVNANVAVDSAVSALQELDTVYDLERRPRRNTGSFDDDSSDQDSFVSATDVRPPFIVCVCVCVRGMSWIGGGVS